MTTPTPDAAPRPTLVLTGASRGIGHATVKRFSAAGWRVITCSRQPFSDKCPWPAGEADHIQVDLADPDDLEDAVEEIRRRLGPAGRLDALVNNAGISPKGEGGRRLDSRSTPTETWRSVFQVNFFAPIMLARGLFPELVAARGSVVNVTSIAGGRVHPFAGTAYSTSKAALAALTREMAADFGPHGIRVNAIAPGGVETPMWSNMPWFQDLVKERGSERAAFDSLAQMATPLARYAAADDVARLIIMLLSDASPITGATLVVDGGYTI